IWVAGKMIAGKGGDGSRARVPPLVIRGEEGRETVATNNEEKGEAFFEAFFPKRTAPRVDGDQADYPAEKWKYHPVTDEEITAAIKELKPYKKSKLESPSNAVFVNAREILVPYLGPLFRATDTTNFYPSNWKITETPILWKPGKGDYTVTGAYRPIVLADGIARLLNTCKTRSLVFHVEKHKLLPDHHFG
ncbi:hypothetical protein BJ165DRAFT_1333453, partial [Panaeolus papilionaceus]